MKLEEIENKDGFWVFHSLPSTDAQTSTRYGVIFTAIKPCEVLYVTEVHSSADAGAGSRSINIEKLTGTTAPGSGTSIVVGNMSVKTTANTVSTYSGALLTSTKLDPGDRLAIRPISIFSVEGINVTIYLKPRGKGDYR